MNPRTLILTAAVSALLVPAANARMLQSEHSYTGSKSSSSATSLSAMTRAGTHYHATARTSSASVRPDDRAGIRGA